MLRSLAAGLAGALALNAAHEAAHRLAPPGASAQMPRLDRLGTWALARALGLDVRPQREADDAGPVYVAALALDTAVNTVGYALVGDGTGRPVLRGLALGLGGGALAVAGAAALGRSRDVARAPVTPAATVAWYVVGGVVAGLAARALARRATPDSFDPILEAS